MDVGTVWRDSDGEISILSNISHHAALVRRAFDTNVYQDASVLFQFTSFNSVRDDARSMAKIERTTAVRAEDSEG